MEIIIITFISIILAQLTWDLIVEFFNAFKTLTCDSKEKEMSDTYVTLDEFYNEDHKAIKQVVYKVEGNFNGNISGDNVTVILMGDGSINGNIESKDGNVVLIKGNINGDVKANKVLCPTEPKTGSNSSDCFKCAWLDENGTCKSWDVNEGKCEYVGKTQFETLWSCYISQGTSPQKRTDHYTSIGNHVSIYDSFPVTHIKCPHCKKYFATQVKVRTSVVDGDVVETRVEEMRHDY